jgi:hypothetical protein
MEEQGCRQYSAEQAGRQAGQIRQLVKAYQAVKESGTEEQAGTTDQAGRKSGMID